jgi:hypothetical protein
MDQQQQQNDEINASRKLYPTRWDVTSIPVFVPKQKYDVYGRSWLTTINNNNNDENMSNVLNSAQKYDWKRSGSHNTIIPTKRTWCCIIMSTLYTFIFYSLCLGTIPIVVFYVYNSFKTTVSSVDEDLNNNKNNTGMNDSNKLGN